MKRLNAGILSLLAGLMVVSISGCMIGPTSGDHIGNIQNRISPGGFVLDGDSLIEVQAYNFESRRWVTLATTRSSSGSIAWENIDWHYWQSPQFSLPFEYWDVSWGNGTEGYQQRYARLRALGDGAELFTFKDWNLGPLSDMQDDVNGTELILFGDRIYIE